MEKHSDASSFPAENSSTSGAGSQHVNCNNPPSPPPQQLQDEYAARGDLCSNAYNFNGPKVKVNAFGVQNDAEMKRKKRVASYKVLAVEGKMKSSVRSSFKWLKTKYTEIRYGW